GDQECGDVGHECVAHVLTGEVFEADERVEESAQAALRSASGFGDLLQGFGAAIKQVENAITNCGFDDERTGKIPCHGTRRCAVPCFAGVAFFLTVAIECPHNKNRIPTLPALSKAD